MCKNFINNNAWSLYSLYNGRIIKSISIGSAHEFIDQLTYQIKCQTRRKELFLALNMYKLANIDSYSDQCLIIMINGLDNDIIPDFVYKSYTKGWNISLLKHTMRSYNNVFAQQTYNDIKNNKFKDIRSLCYYIIVHGLVKKDIYEFVIRLHRDKYEIDIAKRMLYIIANETINTRRRIKLYINKYYTDKQIRSVIRRSKCLYTM